MSEIKSRPILFSAPMVNAILNGRKVQTRRIMKTQPRDYKPGPNVHAPRHEKAYFDSYCNGPKTEQNPRRMSQNWCWWTPDDRQGADWIKCPYGVPGDRLWVRETFYIDNVNYIGKPLIGLAPVSDGLYYRADGDCCDQIPECQCASPEVGKPAWRPSIFMPRWASRLELEITAIRAGRLQDISEADAIAEGSREPSLVPIVGACYSERDVYAKLWESINGAGSWARNEWVWVVEFQQVAQ